MGSSPGIRVYLVQLSRPIRTRFRYGFPRVFRRGVNLAALSNSPDHYAKGTRSGVASTEAEAIALPQFVSSRFQVLFHSPYRGTFQLSFTLLVHYRSTISI